MSNRSAHALGGKFWRGASFLLRADIAMSVFIATALLIWMAVQ